MSDIVNFGKYVFRVFGVNREEGSALNRGQITISSLKISLTAYSFPPSVRISDTLNICPLSRADPIIPIDTGIDLHSTNNYLGVIDEQDRRLYKRRLPNDLGTILSALEPFKDELAGIV
ncbi:MAG: hypothetical protein SWO11_22335, partial [Thermodesulfobacteriota bacterium]|nr:hypothetical protein [Thermodesulfobacteriota bacterium]